MSFDSLDRCLNNLKQLTHLSIDATGTLDLLDGTRWERFLSKKPLVKFYFKFTLALDFVCNQNDYSVLESFRSPFWLKEKRWFVACHKSEEHYRWPSIYSVPYFVSDSIQSCIGTYPPLSTVPSDLQKQIFYDSRIDSLWYFHFEKRGLQKYPFSNVNSLHLSPHPSQFSYELLLPVLDFRRVRILDLSQVQQMSSINLSRLLSHTHRLEHLVIRQSDQPLILPLHIRSLYLKRNLSDDAISFENIEKLRYELSHIRHLEIKVQSTAMIIEIIDRFDQLESIIFHWVDLLLREELSAQWFRHHTRRLKENKFTYRIGHELERSPFGRYIGCGYRPLQRIVYLSIATDASQLSETNENEVTFWHFFAIYGRRMFNKLWVRVISLLLFLTTWLDSLE